MKALVLHNHEPFLRFEDVPTPTPQHGEAQIRLQSASLNHRDEWIRRGQYARIQYPSILGSDGAGIVECVGNPDDASWIGKEVIISPSSGWGRNESAQHPKDYSVLGMPSQGTFAEYIVVPLDRLHIKPPHLSMDEASALPLAGLTAYRAVVTQGEITATSKVLITGIGGGVAQYALQFARAYGAEVWVTSGSDEKLIRAKELGAKGGVNYQLSDWHTRLLEQAGEFDVVIDSVCGDHMNILIETLRYGGRYVFFGATLGKPTNLNVQRIFWKQIRLQGTTMGSDHEFERMIAMVSAHTIVPMIDSVIPLANGEEAFRVMRKTQQFGKIILRINSLHE